jgi:hypothetical protein
MLQLTIPLSPAFPGQDLCRDLYRWDQRLFTFVLRVSPHPPTGNNQKPVAAANGGGVIATLGPLSEATGGKLHIIMSMKHLLSTIEGISQRVPASGVIANFEPLPMPQERSLPMTIPTPPSAMRKLIYARPGPASNWPLPDEMTLSSYVAGSSVSSSSNSNAVFRNGQPTIRFNPNPVLVPHHPGDFAVDRYVIEQCSLSEWMITTCNTMAQSEQGHLFMAQLTGVATQINKEHLCFECCVQPASSSSQSDLVPPSSYFGFLKPHFESNSIHLWVLPYNYPFLFQLLNAWGMSGTPKWRDDFARYIKSVPGYYFPYLQQALSRWKPPAVTGISFSQPPHSVQTLLADMAPLQNPALSITLSSYIKQSMRSLKEESDKLDVNLTAHREALKAAGRGISRPKTGMSVSQFNKSFLSSTPSTPGGPDSARSLITYAGDAATEGERASSIKTPNSNVGSSKSHSGQGTPQGASAAATPTASAGRTPATSSTSRLGLTRVDLYSIHPSDLLAYIERIATLPPVDESTDAPPLVFETSSHVTMEQMDVDSHAVLHDKHGSEDKHEAPRMQKPSTLSIPVKFRVPISEMGNYQELLAKQKNLRPIDEESVSHRSYFGNPYARKGKGTPSGGVLVDEADVSAGEAAALRSSTVPSAGPGKRKGAPAGSASEKDSKLRQKLPKVSASTNSVSSSTPHQEKTHPPVSSSSPVVVSAASPPSSLAPQDASAKQPPQASISAASTASTPTPSIPKPTKPPLLQKPSKPSPAVSVPASVPTVVGLGPSAAAAPQVLGPVVLQPPSGPSPAARGLEMLQIRNHNNSIKFSIIEIIREPPGVPIEARVVERLKALKGDAAARRRVVKEVVVMALQYKRPLSIPELS